MKPTLDSDEAARFLKIHIETLFRLARDGKIPAAKIGRSWVFVTADLIQHLRAKYRQQLDKEGKPWGTSEKKVLPEEEFHRSPRTTVLAYRRALAPAPKK